MRNSAMNDITDIIKLAISRELSSYEFYDQLASSINDKKSSILLRGLADVERTHKAKLESLLGLDIKRLAVEREFLDQAIRLTESEPKDIVQIKSQSDISEVLQAAIIKEEWSSSLYTTLKMACIDKKKRILFDLLAREEQAHIDTLNKMHDRLQQSGVI